MDLFKRKHKQPAPFGGIMMAEALKQPVSYDDVLEYLVGLSEDDYKKVCQVAAIYRAADKSAAEALGNDLKPTTFINPPSNTELVPAHVNHAHPGSFLDDDEDADIAQLLDDPDFIETEPKKTKAKEAK